MGRTARAPRAVLVPVRVPGLVLALAALITSAGGASAADAPAAPAVRLDADVQPRTVREGEPATDHLYVRLRPAQPDPGLWDSFLVVRPTPPVRVAEIYGVRPTPLGDGSLLIPAGALAEQADLEILARLDTRGAAADEPLIEVRFVDPTGEGADAATLVLAVGAAPAAEPIGLVAPNAASRQLRSEAAHAKAEALRLHARGRVEAARKELRAVAETARRAVQANTMDGAIAMEVAADVQSLEYALRDTEPGSEAARALRRRALREVRAALRAAAAAERREAAPVDEPRAGSRPEAAPERPAGSSGAPAGGGRAGTLPPPVPERGEGAGAGRGEGDRGDRPAADRGADDRREEVDRSDEPLDRTDEPLDRAGDEGDTAERRDRVDRADPQADNPRAPAPPREGADRRGGDEAGEPDEQR
jgi:hypothetical protein